MLTEAQYDEMARLLLADVEGLVPLAFPDGRPVSEMQIRFMAVTMRRWLVDGDLKKILAPLRQSALFNVQGNSQAEAYAVRSRAFRYYLTAGIMANGRPVTHIYESPLHQDSVDQSFIREGAVCLPLKKFLAHPLSIMTEANSTVSR